MENKALQVWEEYKETIPKRRTNFFKQNKILYIEKGHFLTYVILLVLSFSTIIACLYIPHEILRDCLICVGTGLFASILISSIMEIINNKRNMELGVEEFNRLLYRIYTYTVELSNVANVQDTIIEREARSRYNKKYGPSSEYDKRKMATIINQVKKEFNVSNISNIKSIKNSLGVIMFEVDKSISLVISSIADFRNRFPTPRIQHLDDLINYKRKLFAWDKAIQCFIYRFAEPSINYFQNIANQSKAFIETNFIMDNYIK